MTARSEDDREIVVLLHGIGQRNVNMFGVQCAMKRAGYHTVNLTYPSTKMNLAEIAIWLHEELSGRKLWEQQGRINFISHSMGGLVVRQYLENYKEVIPQNRMGRVVMIAPPNNGSEIADLLQNFPLYKWFFGRAGQELTTSSQHLNTPFLQYEVGIIAGTIGWPYLLASLYIKGKHDGRVSVDNTKLKGMKDHIEVKSTHSFIAWMPNVHKQIEHFLKSGIFLKS